jgi:hypothetical protein
LNLKRKVEFEAEKPIDPKTPRSQLTPRPQDPGLRGRSREKKKDFFGIVPPVTHPSGIPILGCLTPKFLSFFYHGLQALVMLKALRVKTLKE